MLVSMIGCSSQSIIQKKVLIKESIPYCYEEQECEQMWSAAFSWVVNTIGLPVEQFSNTLLTTANTPLDSSKLSVKIQKIATDKDIYVIVIEAGCDNTAYCNPDIYDSIISFNQFVLKHRKQWGLSLYFVNGHYLVKQVIKNSAADKFGFEKGDLVISIDGQIVNSLNEPQIALKLLKSMQVTFTIKGKGKIKLIREYVK